MEQYKPQIERVVEAAGAHLVEVEVDRSMKPLVLRVLADTANGITVDQCVQINRALCEALPLDLFPGEYQIEVASPGAERELRTLADVEQAIGHYVYARLHAAVDQQTELYGTLLRVSDESGDVILMIKNTSLHAIPYATIAYLRRAVHI